MSPFRPRFYYLAPVSEIPPDGPIRLGNLISVPRMVAEPINDEPVPPVSLGERVYLHHTSSESVTVDTSKSGHLGIFAEFLDGLGIGGGAQGEAGNSDKEEWSFETLKTIWFSPSLEYVKRSLEDKAVKAFIQENKTWIGGKKLYMVTGVKIAYGASSTIQHAKNKGLNLHLGVDLAPLGIPITVGPELGGESALAVKQSREGADPFVFAFRLRQVKISSAGDVSQKDFNRGALLRLGKGQEKAEKEVEIVVEGLEDDDAVASEFTLQGFEATDEAVYADTVCMCAKTN